MQQYDRLHSVPVSYTHLDVYKRQEIYSTMKLILLISGAVLITFEIITLKLINSSEKNRNLVIRILYLLLLVIIIQSIFKIV